MTWFRHECNATDDDLFDRLGADLGVTTGQAFYHYMAFTEKVAEWDTGGQMRTLLDSTVEKWGKWTGTPGGFAGTFRRLCQDEQTGELRGFRKRNQKLLQKQQADRNKRKTKTSISQPSPSPQETPGGLPSLPSLDPTANGNSTTPRGDEVPLVVAIHHDRTMSGPQTPLEVDLWRRLEDEDARAAVWAVLSDAPSRQTGDRAAWAARLRGWLQGLDLAAGVIPTPAQLATACRDYAGDYSPIHFRAFVERVVREAKRPTVTAVTKGNTADQTRRSVEGWRPPA